MKNCNKKHCIISVIAVFAFMMLYDFIVHGHLLTGMYEATASLWRPQAEMEQMGVWCLLYHGLLAMVIVCLYKKFAKGAAACAAPGEPVPCQHKSGMCFGLKIGMLMGLMNASFYIWLPIPGNLAIAWFVAQLVKGVGIGMILGMLCKKMGNEAA